MSGVEFQIRQKGTGFLTSHPPLLSFPSLAHSLPVNSINAFQKQESPPPLSSPANKISPAILFIIITLAIIFFICGLLHLLVKCLSKHRFSSAVSESNRYPTMPGSDSFQTQLQELFHLHDSGLEQALIEALPVFTYKEIIGPSEPFDCAVCLCEFSEQDRLRLLPLCNHAFHLDCIDTWLLSNSTCPLCRATLYSAPGLAFENLFFDPEDGRSEEGLSGNERGETLYGHNHKTSDSSIVNSKRVFSVRLGKFRSSSNGEEVEGKEGESSSSNLNGRRCYSMGSYEYVVANSDLQVTLCPNYRDLMSGLRAAQNRNLSNNGDAEEKRINYLRNKGESFSVSKIWLWSKKDKFPSTSEIHTRHL